MTTGILVLTIVTAAAAMVLVAAGVSLMVWTTRSRVARLICRLGLGLETDDLEKYLEQLFRAHAEALPEAEHMTLEKYRRSLARAGASALVLGVMLLVFLAYALALATGGA